MSGEVPAIEIEELPDGCVLTETGIHEGSIMIQSPEDALRIYHSLKRLIQIQFPEYLEGLE